MCVHPCRITLYKVQYKHLPFHGNFPCSQLSGVDIIKASSVVVWVCATKDQLSTWGPFWIPENNK